MKIWFYKNVVLIYILAMMLIIGGGLCFIHSFVSVETFNALCSASFALNFLIIASTIFVGIWGENKIEKLKKGE